MSPAVRVLGLLLLGCVALPPAALAQERAGSGARLSVHARSAHGSARAEQAAWVSLTLPLGASAASAVPQPSAAEPSVAQPSDAAPSDAALPEAALSLPRLQALAEFARRAALAASERSGAQAERRRLDALASRARWSALLPDLRLRAQRNTDQALRWAPTRDDPYRVTQADGAGTTLEASATFELDRLVFTRDELSIAALRERAGTERAKLEGRVLAALLGLFRARELGCSDVEPQQRLEQLLRAAEHFAELDVLTAGWFSAQASGFSRAVWGFSEAVLGQCSPPPPPPAAPPTKAVATHQTSG